MVTQMARRAAANKNQLPGQRKLIPSDAKNKALHWPLYDSRLVATGALSQEFFLGTNGVHSNVTMSRQFGSKWHAYGMQVFVLTTVLADIVAIATGYLSFKRSTVEMFSSPLALLGSGGGVGGFATTTVSATTFAAYGLDRGPNSGLQNAIEVAKNEEFSVLITWPAAITLTASTRVTVNIPALQYNS